MDQTDSYPVKLYIYDLSRGMARQLSPVMLGKFLTSHLLVGREWYSGLNFDCFNGNLTLS